MKRHHIILVIVGVLSALSAAGVMAQTEQPDPCEQIAPAGVSATFYVGQGDAFFKVGNYTLAIVAYTCAVAQDSTYAPAYANRGFAYSAQGNEDQALADYNQALELDELLVSAYNNRGILYMNQGNFGLAINDFTLAVSLDPAYATAFHNRALVHAAEGNYDLAITDLEQAIQLNPDFAAPYATLGVVYSAMAVKSYEQYMQRAGEGVRLPAGDADIVINSLTESRETGDFSVWLTLLTPAS